ncbi:hypothetical protein [Streptomyces sp. NPDC056291]|uniref:hypothetical protein n=1 Tax=Streptomyces sp. NPDC056291 TaxID=3345772 RepID=UPI0035E067BD
MNERIDGQEGGSVRVRTRIGPDDVTHEVRVRTEDADGRHVYVDHTPAQARELAAALLRGADEAEGREPIGALKHIMAVLDMQYDADEIAEDPSILTQIRADAERMVRMVRDEVARELETLQRFNDIADWCAHIGYRAAVDTARNGRRV